MTSLPSSAAVWFAGPRQIELRSEIVPPPAPGEAQIEALVSAISHGTEMLVYRGQVPSDLSFDLPTFQGSFAFPIKYGYAVVGRVRAVGPGLTRIHVGDLVFALHPHQQLFNAPERVIQVLHPDTPPEHGIFTANLETALNITLDAGPRLSETVMVFGLGVVGLLTARLLAETGVGQLIVVDPLIRRRQLAYDLSCATTFAPDIDLGARIRTLTEGRGADMAIEVSGSPGALQSAIDCVADEGTVVVASWYGVKQVALELGSRFHRGRIRLRSSQVGRLPPELAPRWDYARRSRVVVDLLRRINLSNLITHRVPFADAAAAYQLIDQHPDNSVQVVLTYP